MRQKDDPIILGEGLVLSDDTQIPNHNMLIVGSSGTGKSMSIIIPNIIYSENTNPIVNFAKEFDAECMARYLSLCKGYDVDMLNLSNTSKKSTVIVDPLLFIESYEDIDALSAAIVNGTITKTVDDYWQAKAVPLLSSLIAAVFMTSDPRTNPGTVSYTHLTLPTN